MAKMGMSMGLDSGQYCKRQHRWMFEVYGVFGEFSGNNQSRILPPLKSARPNISFKEMNVKHLIEDVYYPAKPDWKPIAITLYDLHKRIHPVFEWMKNLYDPERGNFYPPNDNRITNRLRQSPHPVTKQFYFEPRDFIKQCNLHLYDGCGSTIESWIFEDCWPQNINFQTLDFGQDGIVMCDLTLRYARSYIK